MEVHPKNIVDGVWGTGGNGVGGVGRCDDEGLVKIVIHNTNEEYMLLIFK